MPPAPRSTLRLILGDQLNHRHSWFNSTDDSVTYLLMEMRQETDYVMRHVQKVCAFFMAMRRFADWLKSRGHRVVYLTLDDRTNRQDLCRNIRHLIEKHEIARFEYQLPDEYRLDLQLRQLCGELTCETQAFDSEHFLTDRDEVGQFFADRKEWRMEYFYRMMRTKHDVLMENDAPAGGKWNYDVENRRKWNGDDPLPRYYWDGVTRMNCKAPTLSVSRSIMPTPIASTAS